MTILRLEMPFWGPEMRIWRSAMLILLPGITALEPEMPISVPEVHMLWVEMCILEPETHIMKRSGA